MTENNEPINSNIIDKSGFVVGFLAAVFILYSFKDFFDRYRLDLGLFNLSLTNIVVGFIVLLLISMYLYAINYIRYDFPQLLYIKQLRYVEIAAHFIYLSALLIYPLLVVFVWVLYATIHSIYEPLNYEIKEIIAVIIYSILLITGLYSILKLLLKRKKYILSELKTERDIEINAIDYEKLNNNKYIAILEIYKAIIDSLKYELFVEAGLDSRKLHGSKVIKIAKELSIISEEDYNYLFKLNTIRNRIAHAEFGIVNNITSDVELDELISKSSKFIHIKH